MTGTGWKTLGSGITHLGPNLPVNYLLLERQGGRLLVYYWNIQQGQWRVLSSDRINKLHIFLSTLKRHRSDWTLVRLITPVNGNMELARKSLAAFAQQLIPQLPKFISMGVNDYHISQSKYHLNRNRP
ncbi:MAG: EpsI family protein [Deltaproteobacteria bacterium]